jgi:hypothetical protein
MPTFQTELISGVIYEVRNKSLIIEAVYVTLYVREIREAKCSSNLYEIWHIRASQKKSWKTGVSFLTFWHRSFTFKF